MVSVNIISTADKMFAMRGRMSSAKSNTKEEVKINATKPKVALFATQPINTMARISHI